MLLKYLHEFQSFYSALRNNSAWPPPHLLGCYWLLVHGDRRFPPGLYEVPRPGKQQSRTGVLMATEYIVEWRHKVDAHVVWLSVPKCRLSVPKCRLSVAEVPPKRA